MQHTTDSHNGNMWSSYTVHSKTQTFIPILDLVPAGSSRPQPRSHSLPSPGSLALMYCFASIAQSPGRLSQLAAIPALKSYTEANDGDAFLTSYFLRASWVMLQEGPLPGPQDSSTRVVNSTQISAICSYQQENAGRKECGMRAIREPGRNHLVSCLFSF